jgi:hypothetical protein
MLNWEQKDLNEQYWFWDTSNLLIEPGPTFIASNRPLVLINNYSDSVEVRVYE